MRQLLKPRGQLLMTPRASCAKAQRPIASCGGGASTGWLEVNNHNKTFRTLKRRRAGAARMTYESVASHRPSDVSRLDRACVVTSRCALLFPFSGWCSVRAGGRWEASFLLVFNSLLVSACTLDLACLLANRVRRCGALDSGNC